MHMDSQQRLSNTNNFIIIREVPLIFIHLSIKSYYYRHIEPLYQGKSATGQGDQDKYIYGQFTVYLLSIYYM